MSGRWLLTALAIAIPGAALCCWIAFCLLFWQGSWQLLYHPSATISRTPSNIGLAYDQVGFATSDTGTPQLQGWWIPSPSAHLTVLYLHDQAGSLGDTLDDLARLHTAGVNVLAFDYRGYGASQFVHPSEAAWRQDANWALDYLTSTRHVDAHAIVLFGTGLGANLALEVAAGRPELAGVVLQSPMESPVDAIFNDGRARIVPAHLLIHDRYDLIAPAIGLRIPSLWIMQSASSSQAAPSALDEAFQKVAAPKMRVWLKVAPASQQDFQQEFSRWLDDLRK